MKAMNRMCIVLLSLVLVMSCSLFQQDEGPTADGGNKPESSTGPGGGTEIETDDQAADEEDADEESTDEAEEPKNKFTKVSFRKGKSSRSYSSSIVEGGSHTFSIAASGGQVMNIGISTKKNNAEVKVLSPSGAVLANTGSTKTFSAALPADGTYKAVVTSGGGDDSFTLDFAVTGAVNEEEDAPESGGLTKTVKFSKGRSSASYSDAVVRGTRNNYILGAKGGQLMTVSISSVEDNAVFQIRGPGGYLRGAEPGTDRRSWSGQLPADGKYTIIVGGTRGNATYTVRFAIQ